MSVTTPHSLATGRDHRSVLFSFIRVDGTEVVCKCMEQFVMA